MSKNNGLQDMKGSSLLKLPNDYVSIDLETTGFDYYFCNIIEIGAVRVRNNKIVEEFQTLINPQCEIDDFIVELTGITNDMLSGAPVFDNIIQSFIDFIDDDLLVAHNINFDLNFLNQRLNIESKPTIKNDFVDTMRLSRWFFKDYANHKLDTVARNLGITAHNRHRAIGDSITTKLVIDKMQEHVVGNNIDMNTFFNRNHGGHGVDARDITTDNIDFDIDHPLYNKNIVFTGVLKMVRKEAMQIVTDLGGHCQNGINKQTNILIMGNNDFCTTIKDGKSSKQKKAEEYILNGQDLIIITENTFYDMM